MNRWHKWQDEECIGNLAMLLAQSLHVFEALAKDGAPSEASSVLDNAALVHTNHIQAAVK